MRLQLRSVLMCAVSCAGVLAFAPAAQAQSLFQKLLGLGSNPAQQPPAAQIPARRLPSVRFQSRGLRRWHSIPQTAEEEIGPPDSGGPYRTMCVRACDGYYFPIRHNARRRNFASDVKSCRNACGDEARLFYFPENGGSADTMTDLAGRPYAERPNAFAYRKALVSSCTCKPAPWSREEAARHQSYAAAEDAQVAAAQTGPANQTAMPQPPEGVSGQLEPAAALPEGEIGASERREYLVCARRHAYVLSHHEAGTSRQACCPPKSPSALCPYAKGTLSALLPRAEKEHELAERLKQRCGATSSRSRAPRRRAGEMLRRHRKDLHPSAASTT